MQGPSEKSNLGCFYSCVHRMYEWWFQYLRCDARLWEPPHTGHLWKKKTQLGAKTDARGGALCRGIEPRIAAHRLPDYLLLICLAFRSIFPHLQRAGFNTQTAATQRSATLGFWMTSCLKQGTISSHKPELRYCIGRTQIHQGESTNGLSHPPRC